MIGTAGRTSLPAAVVVLVATALVGCTANSTPGATTSTSDTQIPSPTMSSTASAMPSSSCVVKAAPREGWDSYPAVGNLLSNDPYAGLSGIAEVRGELFALGRASRDRAGIFVSADGCDWTQGELPESPAGLGFGVLDIQDAGERLVALAAGGLVEGSGAFATMIYVSDDGRSWTAAASTPGIEAGAHYDLVRVGTRLLALGQSVWTSDDGGLTWIESTSSAVLGGQVADATVAGDLAVGVGQAGLSDVSEPPAYAWISTDAGLSWRRSELDSAGIGYAVAIGADGRIVTLGSGNSGAPISWTSGDGGVTWDQVLGLPCCVSTVVATASGFVALSGYGDPPFAVITSVDGMQWTLTDDVGFGVRAANWGRTFGLVAVGENVLGFGPYPIQ